MKAKMTPTSKMTLDDLKREFYAHKIPSSTGAQEWFWRNRCADAMKSAWSEFCESHRCTPDMSDLASHPALETDYMRRVIDALRPIRAEMMGP